MQRINASRVTAAAAAAHLSLDVGVPRAIRAVGHDDVHVVPPRVLHRRAQVPCRICHLDALCIAAKGRLA